MLTWLKSIFEDVFSNESVLGDPPEKEKLKNLTLSEINEMLIAKQRAEIEEENYLNKSEAQEHFDALYSEIIRGNFKMLGKDKRLVVLYRGKVSNLKVGERLQEMFKESGYVLVTIDEDKRRWVFGLVTDMAHNAEGFFSSYSRFGGYFSS